MPRVTSNAWPITLATDSTQVRKLDVRKLGGGVVSDGVVHDHVLYRLHGANGRYSASGVPGAASTSKRALSSTLTKARIFKAATTTATIPDDVENDGDQNCWENRVTYTFSLNEVVNLYLWNQLGVPCPLGNFAHFRTIKQSAEQPDAWHGDFWGLMLSTRTTTAVPRCAPSSQRQPLQAHERQRDRRFAAALSGPLRGFEWRRPRRCEEQSARL